MHGLGRKETAEAVKRRRKDRRRQGKKKTKKKKTADEPRGRKVSLRK